MRCLTSDKSVCQVEISPDILRVYRAYLVVSAHKILAADTRCKGAKNCPKLGRTLQIRATAHACDNSTPRSGAVFTSAF
jgi:hypothetical protein